MCETEKLEAPKDWYSEDRRELPGRENDALNQSV